ncbi:unnamed protein product [Ascophyllum nodosum]
MPPFTPAAVVLIREYYDIPSSTPSSDVWGHRYNNMLTYPPASEVSRRHYDERGRFDRRHEEITQEVTVQAISYGPGSGYRYTQPTNTVIRTERTWIDPLPPQPFWDQYGRRVQ